MSAAAADRQAVRQHEVRSVPSAATNEATQREWRELGFFYERDDAVKEWRIVGSLGGLLGFARLLHDYAVDSRNDRPSEHEHFGPYRYLEIGTSSDAEITDHWIAGRLCDLLGLSALIQDRLAAAKVGDRLTFRAEYAPSSPYELVLAVREDAFDPPLADPNCW